MTQFYCMILLPESEAQPGQSDPQASGDWQERAEVASRYLKLRAKRSAIAEAHLWSDPAWDILLELFVGHVKGKNITVTSACLAARRPSTTSLRYIDRMLQEGLLQRERDPIDNRKINLRITDQAFRAVSDWVDALREQIAAV
ncbi:MarR family winged helix-turn-helix transcriptional regulator [Blastomonas sp.]|uniref:MarR family winged helix-turn-helix transcriptional regulator n=1 Tax=Blastomonas sp. TaxID=1909299 RepID=UPI002626F2E2|nr:MarR family winged helix-turn-helix transcriptional regulator [Blastomonas sp.]MDM7957530.1 MarR family winged helix-turn-helix transcriptional regulator [Blastomonas sp.]